MACPTQGVKQVPVPWAEPGGQFTALFERFGIDLLRECAVQGAADLLRITWDEAWGIKARAVTRGLARREAEVVAHLGVDEKAIAKRHKYLTVVADLDRSRVLSLAADRKQESLDGLWATHSGLKPMAEVAKLIQRHLPNILTYLRHGISNAGLEAINAVIQWLKKTARGFRNPENFKTAVYFHCGDVDLYPHASR